MKSGQRGYVGIASIAILSGLLLIVYAYAVSTQTNLLTIDVYRNSFQAFYTAESGVERSLSQFLQNMEFERINTQLFTPCNEGRGSSSSGLVGGARYSVCITETSRVTVPVDINGDGITDYHELIRRSLDILSEGTLRGSSSLVRVQADVFRDSLGQPTYTLSNWRKERRVR